MSGDLTLSLTVTVTLTVAVTVTVPFTLISREFMRDHIVEASFYCTYLTPETRPCYLFIRLYCCFFLYFFRPPKV